MADKRAAPFKGSTKFAIRHIPTGLYYNSARYANGFVKTPSFKNNSFECERKILHWCDDTSADEKVWYAEQLGVPFDNWRDFEVVEFSLIETGIIRHGLPR